MYHIIFSIQKKPKGVPFSSLRIIKLKASFFLHVIVLIENQNFTRRVLLRNFFGFADCGIKIFEEIRRSDVFDFNVPAVFVFVLYYAIFFYHN